MTADLDPIRAATPRQRRDLAHQAGVSIRERMSIVNGACRLVGKYHPELNAEEWREIARQAGAALRTAEALRQYAEGVAVVLDAQTIEACLADAADGR